jgi:hypothetical protein
MMHLFGHNSRADDRLLAGRLASPEDAGVNALVGALRLPGLTDELSGEDATVELMSRVCRELAPVAPVRRSQMKRRSRVGIAAVTVGAALVATTSLAYAGALPGAAQSTAAAALARVGVSVPGPNANAGSHPDSRGHSSSHSAANGHGQAVSTLARTTTATGRDKGAAVSTLASGGKSHAGNPPGKAKTHTATTGHGNPNPGGSSNAGGNTTRGKSGTSGSGVTTGSTASSGHNSHGATTSTTASDGHSSAGSSNAGSHSHSH